MNDRINFDPFDPKTRQDAPEEFAKLARQCPIHRYRGRFDFFIENDPAYISGVMLKDPAIWTVEKGSAPTPLPSELRTRIMMDGPSHAKIRHVVQRGFTAQDLARLKAIVEQLANELIDTMLAIPGGNGDFFELFAMPLPGRFMCLMLGAPEKDYRTYNAWAEDYFYSINNEPGVRGEESMERMRQVTTSLFQLIAERHAMIKNRGLERDLSLVGTALPNDFLSRFMCEKIDGEYLEDMEILTLMIAIIIGGNETTMSLVGNLLWRLLEVRERWMMLEADPSLIEVAIEECLRLDPPVLGMCRTPRSELALHGVSIPAEAKVLYNISAVNRDPAVWANPEEFRLDRPLSSLRRHASFGGGLHLCLGAPLARMEVKTVFEVLIRRLPNLRLAGEAVGARGFSVWGKTKLPVTWQ